MGKGKAELLCAFLRGVNLDPLFGAVIVLKTGNFKRDLYGRPCWISSHTTIYSFKITYLKMVKIKAATSTSTSPLRPPK